MQAHSIRHLVPRARSSRWLVFPATLLMLLGATACEDPLAHLEQAKQAVEDGVKLVASTAVGDSFEDDEAAKSRSKGVSLGAAKRLYYQFVDKRGQVRFVERMSDVPEQWRARVGFVEMDSPPPLSPMMADNTRAQRFQEVAHKYRKIMPRKVASRVVLYSADWCGWCKKAKRHLDRKGINYEVRDIDRPEYLEELIAKTGQKGIPVLDVGGKVVTGFSPDRYDELIRSS